MVGSSDGVYAGSWVDGSITCQVVGGVDFDGDGNVDPTLFYPNLNYIQWRRSSDDVYQGLSINASSPYILVTGY